MYESTFYGSRQPLLPINDIIDFYHIAKCSDEQYLLGYLIEKFTTNYQLKESLYLASDVLYNEIIKYKTLPSSFSSKEKKRILHSLSKYYIRASTRATPFGLFANFREGSFHHAEKTHDIYPEPLDYYPKLDMEVLFQIGEYISRINGIEKKLILHNNTSLYKTKDDYRYIEYRMVNGKRTHHLVSIKPNNLLNFIIRISKNGINYDTLITEIRTKYDVTNEDLEKYISNLMSCKLLVTNLDINITGKDYFYVLLDFILEVSCSNMVNDEILSLKNILLNINTLIQTADNRQSNIGSYQKIHELLKKILPNIPEKNLIQLDVVSTEKDYTLQFDSISNLSNLLSIFSSFSKSYPPQNFQLEIFKRAFSERYESRKVKLTEALDEEIGIGYKSAKSIRDIYDSKVTGKTKFTGYILKKYHEYLRQNKTYIEITDEDINENFGDFENIETIEPGFTYLINAYPRKEKSVLHVISYSPSITAISGRFCGMHQNFYGKLNSLVNSIEKKNNNYIYAEIVHLPQARVGNVIARPYFGEYEIPFLANSMLPNKQKIFIDDLYIQMINNELYLFSEKLNKPILPRLSNAHSYRKTGLPMYHFLCDMQFQNFNSPLIWDWGIVQDIEEYLPRVMYKNIIIQQAYWIIKDENFVILKKSKDFNSFKENLLAIKQKLFLNDLVVFKESDNVLYFDLSTTLGIELLQKYLNNQDNQVILYESLLDETAGESGNKYSKELIVPFIQNNSKNVSRVGKQEFFKDSINRTFIPGSEWLYFKIYIGHKFSDKLLTIIGEHIENKFVNKGLVDKWFFIRYSDPKSHLRIRFLVKDLSIVMSVVAGLNKLFNYYVKSGKISSIVQDTYQRELERYKHKNIIESETLFYYDSKLVYNLYRSFNVISNNYLFLISFFIIEEYIDTLDGNNLEKLSFLERNFKYFAKEFDYEKDKSLRNSLHKELRKMKDITIEDTLNPKIIDIINKSKIKDILRIIKSNLKDDYTDVLSSYIHMSVNRMFSEKQRFNEFKIYFFLYKKYQSIIARSAKS